MKGWLSMRMCFYWYFPSRMACGRAALHFERIRYGHSGDGDENAYFYQGDIVRLATWLIAGLTFDEDYEQRYRFFANDD
ncbi:hypothetical protein R1flu_025642 [Riccia fluitans]|uniref:Uncharacterized protein n=1 Tax=Riccia fluitans TaxID=41844 RepID=A0ABD1XYB6_9MARC